MITLKKFIDPLVLNIIIICVLTGTGNAQIIQKHWIFFTDKDPLSAVTLNKKSLGISDRAQSRRAKVLSPAAVIDRRDLPVQSAYTQILMDHGVRIIGQSRWLNGVSAILPSENSELIRNLPFVRGLQPVRLLSQKPEDIKLSGVKNKTGSRDQSNHLLDYGVSYDQVNQIRVPDVHDLGIKGKGILVGVIDTGFDHEDRAIFEEMAILTEHDFHWDDGITSNEDGDPATQHNHGTEVLSITGGFLPGTLIGPAFGATFALAKTEWVPTSDLAVEEDHWIMAIEWLERLGADVVTSSVSYATFVDKIDYTQDDLDGDTGLITIAADIAVSKGVVVLNSAGNRDFWNTVNFPADGDSVIAVGAVSNNGNLASFSSLGPTADGRIKPDMVAQGVGVVAINPSSKVDDEVLFVNGTSFSTPLVAGVCALLLEARPELGPMDVREALRQTAHLSDAPNNQMGWGIINAYDAVFYHGLVFMNFTRIALPAQSTEALEIDVISQTGVPDSVTLHYLSLSGMNTGKIDMISIGGIQSQRYRAEFPRDLNLNEIQFYLSALDNAGEVHLGPVGAPEKMYSFADSNWVVNPSVPDAPESFRLFQNYPNPFITTTNVRFDIIKSGHVKLAIFDAMGRQVVVLIDNKLEAGRKQIAWSGMDETGIQVPSGLYFIRLKVDGKQAVRKMVYVN